MQKILLVGAGPMATAYAEVLNGMNRPFTVIGRGEQSARLFQEKTGAKPVLGGLQSFLKTNQLSKDTIAIIATGTESLMSALIMLTESGISKILIEKPAAISIEELMLNEDRLSKYSETIFIAYNRRFYSSVIEAQKLIDEDGGLLSMHFEFTEWAHKIEPLQKAKGVKENWFFANSTHVVDLAFFIGGAPAPNNWCAFSKKGSVNWHEKTNFSGAGITEKGTLFSYISNWESAGRWAIELLTKNKRIYLKPLEGIGIQQKGTVNVEPYIFDDTIDVIYKPGLYKQVEAFINNDIKRLINYKQQVAWSKAIYSKILE